MPALAPPPAPAKPSSAQPSPNPPAPKPAGGHSPAPGSPPPPPIEKAPQDYLGDITSDLQELSDDGDAKLSGTTPRRGADGKFTKPDDQPKPEPKEAPELDKPTTELEKPADEPKPGTMRALGKAHDAKVKEINEVLRPKIQSLESKVQEYEKTITELRTKQPDLKPVQEKMAAVEKENAALREEIRFANYKKHPEFTEKYEKPYNEAWARAVHEISQLPIETEDGTVRRANEKDILSLANAPLDQLDIRAEKEFGRSSARVIRHIEKIKDLAEAQDKALEDARKGSTEFESKRTMEKQTQDAEIAKTYAETGAELVKKYPKWFAPDEADPAGNELLKKGFDYSSGVFENTPVQVNGETRPLTAVEKVKRLAVIKAKAANHDRLVSRLKSKGARIAELESELKGFTDSEPPTDEAGDKPGGAKPGGFMEDIRSELSKLDR